MTRRPLALLTLAALAAPAVVHATGFGGSDTPTRIPVPARAFSATVEDLSGTVVSLDKVSLDGEVYLSGTVGEATVAVPFEKIVEIRIEPTNDGAKRVAFATLREGEPVRVILDEDTPCYGAATFGHYRIEVGRIRRVTFKP